MKPLYSESDYLLAKSQSLLPMQCYNCDKTFYTQKKLIVHELNAHRGRVKFCNQKCHQIYNHPNTHHFVQCKQCQTSFSKQNNQVNKSTNHFCSRSCSVRYHNLNKTSGTRRSKLEIYLEDQLTKLFPNLEIIYNSKEAINSELDIYIPSKLLAFELNGIFHYEPIYGEKKLIQIQNNDQRKFQACQEHGISLCIIDSSGLKYFKPTKADMYLKIIVDIINSKNNC